MKYSVSYEGFMISKIVPPGGFLATFTTVIDRTITVIKRKVFYHTDINKVRKECDQFLSENPLLNYSILQRKNLKS